MMNDLSRWPRLAGLARRIEALPGARKAFVDEFIPADGALSAPQVPDLPAEEVTGVI